MSAVAPEKPMATGRVKEVNISLAELAKNIDIDGDGEIEPEEREILDTLRSMDVDGDGTISLRELVNLGAKLNQQREQAKFYKRIAFGVMLLAILSIAAVFLACFAAVEAAKDARPTSDGVMKTVVTGKDSKVIATAGYQQSVSLTSLHTASFATLRGIKDVGFKVGNRFYQYTITGFEQDIAADGSSTVRLFSSRGDSIFVSKTAANLERVQSKQVIDISAAVLQNRKLLAELSEDHRRHLLQDNTVPNVGTGNGDITTTNVPGTYNPGVYASLFVQGNDTDTSLPPFAVAAECPQYFQKNEGGNCECRSGYYGDAKFNPTSSKWEVVKPCILKLPPPGTKWECDSALRTCSVSCPMTNEEVTLEHKIDPSTKIKTYFWEFPNNGTECTSPAQPANLNIKSLLTRFELVDHSKISGSTTPSIKELKFETKAECKNGYSSASPIGPTYDPTTKKWVDHCVAAPLPASTRVVPEAGAPDRIKEFLRCVEGTHAEAPYRWFTGFPWDPIGRWVSHMDILRKMLEFNDVKHMHGMMNSPNMTVVWPSKELSSSCVPDQPGYNYTCTDAGCVAQEIYPPHKAKLTKVQNDGNPYVYGECAEGYHGTVEWKSDTRSWNVSCADNMPLCPVETRKVKNTGTCVCNPHSHFGPGYEFKRFATPQFHTTMNMHVVGEYVMKTEKNEVGCVKKSCPPHTVDKSISVTSLDCQCKYPRSTTNGQTKYNTTKRTWDTTNCSTTAPAASSCPTGSTRDATGDCVCNAGTYGIYKEKQALYDCYYGWPGNGCEETWVEDPNSGEWTYTKSPAFVQAEINAAAQDWTWFGNCISY